MRIPILSKGPWLSAAVTIAIAAALLFAHQGAANGDTGPPGAPANPLAHLIVPEGGDPRVRVSWDAPGAPVSGYTIARADGTNYQAAGAATTYSDHAVEPGTSYTYTVTAQNEQGSGPASASAPASVPDAPSQPGGLAAEVAEIQATDEAASVTLTWAASTAPAAEQCETAYPLDGYTVLRSDGSQETEIAAPGKDAASFTDETAAFGVTYTYRVMARSAVGSSTDAETTVTVPVRPVLPATGLTASIADPFDGQVSLSWNAPTEGPAIVGYAVFRYLGADPYQGTDEPVTLDELATGTTLVDATAQAGVTYSYLVLARSADNVSDPSNTAVIEAPAPPSGLTATAGDGAIDLSWQAPTAGTVAGYRVQRQDEQGDWTTLADTTEASHSDGAAQANVQYRYRVQHRNQYGGSAWSESGPVTLVTAPGAPTGLTATVEGNDNVLVWTAPGSPFIDGYRVRHRTGEGDWNALAQDVTDTAYRHEDAQADVIHRYAVQAHNQGGDGSWSDPASATRITPPGVPQNVSAQLDGNDILITWTRPDTVHVSGYTVRHQAGDAAPQKSRRLPESQTSFRMDEVTGDVTHRIAVQAHNDAGDSPWSTDVEITRRLAPSAPTGLAVTVGEADIVLSWGAPATGTPDGYRVEYGEQDSDQLQTENLTAARTSFTHSDNAEGVTYQYRVQAHNAAGDGPWTDPLTATRTLAPPAPTDLATAFSGSAITVSWTAPAGGIIDTYEIKYGAAGSGETATASVGAGQTSFEHTGADGDTTYSYQVRSVNSAGHSGWAGPVEAMWVIPPNIPANVTAVISGNDIVVSWTAPATGIIDRYEVEYLGPNSDEWVRNNAASTAASWTHVSPTPGTEYRYRARSVNRGGISDWTSPVSRTWHQGAAPPRNLGISIANNEYVIVQWNRSTDAGVTSYELSTSINGGKTSVEDLGTRVFKVDYHDAGDTHREYAVRSVIQETPGDWTHTIRASLTRPGHVRDLIANIEGRDAVRIHWDHPDTGQPHRYVIEKKKQGQKNYPSSSKDTAYGFTNTRLIAGMEPATTYNIRVRARSHSGETSATDGAATVTITIPETETVWAERPSNLRIKMVDRTTFRLSWAEQKEGKYEVTGYRIYRKNVANFGSLSNHSNVLVSNAGSTATVFTDHTGSPGVTYEYGISVRFDNQEHPVRGLTTTAFARPW